MACNIVRNKNGSIYNVYTDEGSPSELFQYINNVLDNKEASYIAYLEILTQYQDKAPLNEQGEPDAIVNPEIMSHVVQAATHKGEYVAKNRQLNHEYKKDLLQETLNNFLQKIGVTTTIVDQLQTATGTEVTAIADLLNRTIQMSLDKMDETTLPEEAAHFIIELLRADKNPLYSSMYKLIENYTEFDEVMNPESAQYKLHEGNSDFLKREAIAKVIAKHIMNNDINVQSTETDPKKLSRLRRWWERVKRWLNKVLGRVATDPFLNASHILLQDRLQDVFASDPSLLTLPDKQFFQEGEKTSDMTPLEKIEADQKMWVTKDVPVKDNPYYKKISENCVDMIERYVNIQTGEILEKRMSDAASKKWRRNNEFYAQ